MVRQQQERTFQRRIYEIKAFSFFLNCYSKLFQRIVFTFLCYIWLDLFRKIAKFRCIVVSTERFNFC